MVALQNYKTTVFGLPWNSCFFLTGLDATCEQTTLHPHKWLWIYYFSPLESFGKFLDNNSKIKIEGWVRSIRELGFHSWTCTLVKGKKTGQSYVLYECLGMMAGISSLTWPESDWLGWVRLRTSCSLRNQCAQVKPAITTHTQGEITCMATLSSRSSQHHRPASWSGGAQLKSPRWSVAAT